MLSESVAYAGPDGLTGRELYDNARNFLGAGHETTALTLTWGLWLVAQDAETQRRIWGAFRALPNRQREVFVLRETVNLPFKEIAEITGVPENTVKSRMRYALERLQEALAEFEDYARALR